MLQLFVAVMYSVHHINVAVSFCNEEHVAVCLINFFILLHENVLWCRKLHLQSLYHLTYYGVVHFWSKFMTWVCMVMTFILMHLVMMFAMIVIIIVISMTTTMIAMGMLITMAVTSFVANILIENYIDFKSFMEDLKLNLKPK